MVFTGFPCSRASCAVIFLPMSMDLGIVRDDLTFNSVFQRGHNTAPVGVVFRVGSEDKLDVQR